MCVFCYLAYLGNLPHLIWDGLLMCPPFLFGIVAFRLMILEFVSCGACHIDDGTEENPPLCLHPRTPPPQIIALLLFDHSHVTACSVDQTTQTTVDGPNNKQHDGKVLETLFESTKNVRKFSRVCLNQQTTFSECPRNFFPQRSQILETV